MESEINFEPFTQAERLPSPLPWAVYRTVDNRSGHIVRLSVLWAADHLAPERMRGALEWFAEAGYQAQRLTAPILPSVLLYHSTPEAAYVATDFPDGTTLRERTEDGRRLPVVNAMHLSALIAEVLASVHAVGWAHGWLNPDTVWVSDDRRVAITDLGLGLAAQPVAPGNPAPFPARPGFFSGDPMRRDLQCLGLVLTLMLTGRLPDPVGVPRADIYPDEVPGGVVQRIRNLINPKVVNPMTAAQWSEFARVGASPNIQESGEAGILSSDARPSEDYYDSGADRPIWRRLAWAGGGVALLVAALSLGSTLIGRDDSPGTSGNAVKSTSPAVTAPGQSPRPTTSAPTTQPSATAPDVLTKVQVGPIAPGDEEQTTSRLRQMGFDPYVIREAGGLYIQVGAFSNAEGAKATQEQLKRAGYQIRTK